ncbi:TIGR02757 family protein [Xanthocytophaga flava]|uniref:TIGR02757 family protein n=1 Tax=Xanthocytophaga flava TaxID=3048013 RepID=UPI0028D387D3|nr:TIGR02757 family protein [Xanthocytophaga flavus]MDJ1469420.1 TIGR02757 family protein [Xanthocytophaga flavus]
MQVDLQSFLDEKVAEYNRPAFITNDPISIPHRYTTKQDIEIAGLFAAVLAWGQRKTIINKCLELMRLMDDTPYEFIRNHQETDLKRFLSFKHRTFNATDTLYFIEFLRQFYQQHDSLEDAFARFITDQAKTTEKALIGFRNLFFSLEFAPARTSKHISTPAAKSACKRLNMFLRWMVRTDDKGVDFGIWKRIQPSQLVCPCDVHVERVARHLKLIQRPQLDWQTAVELTQKLSQFDANDPVKYDFALFGLGVEGVL